MILFMEISSPAMISADLFYLPFLSSIWATFLSSFRSLPAGLLILNLNLFLCLLKSLNKN